MAGISTTTMHKVTQQNCYYDMDSASTHYHLIFWDHFGSNVNFQQEFSLKWTSILTRNTFFCTFEAVLAKICCKTHEDQDEKSISLHLSWYQHSSLLCYIRDN